MTASLAVAFLGGAAWYVVSVEKRLAHSFRMVDVMADYQRYADKMRFAGAAENCELARWYLWKLGTASRVVTDGLVEEYRGVEGVRRSRTDSIDAMARPGTSRECY
jgi:hypothetical protein